MSDRSPTSMNNFPLREWHINHAEMVITEYIRGMRKKETLSMAARYINYDKMHGVTDEDISNIMERIRYGKSYSALQTQDKLAKLDLIKQKLGILTIEGIKPYVPPV
ncbi:MAG: hypothetical protein HMLIMOIP_001527 [Candidatus Nitrosomirales archaeon]|jgi:hypothetical protein